MEDYEGLEPEWVDFASLQDRLRGIERVDHKTWALEDQADAFLDSMTKGSLPTESESRAQWLDNLKVNRRKKHQKRLRLLEQHFAAIHTDSPATVVLDGVIQTEQLHRVRALTTPQEWGVLWDLANECDYQALASREHISVVALKTRVCRCRDRLRSRIAA
jgi:hypothetical protein